MKPDKLLSGLPTHLGERSRLLKGATPAAREFVLYWMHHSVRGHENPALDVAIELANTLAVPVLAYQGLGGVNAYNSDRHHAFILEGARDAHLEIERRGVRAVFHLAADANTPSPLRDLLSRAAVFVVEDYPAPPFPNWTARLAENCPCTVVAVDCCCVVPMRIQPQCFERAFEFRKHNKAEYSTRLKTTWREATVETGRYEGKIGCSELDLETADIPALCAACDIDHSIPPIPHTRGGSAAGYARWQRFRDQGLVDYAAKRNDAACEWPQGVSRLSPYLHHGHVSPFRIAREAAAMGGAGAEKFLDELLIWRELSFNFCFHTPEPGTIDALPTWAKNTLAAHAADVRQTLIDNESLARSRSHDELWNLAQDSLRIHGELHNNLRMTWAKAIPHWRPDPQQALATLIALNHRYALDGSDPNSYGGLLWTLGLFDRPFPERPVIGALRSRSTQSHARRLDLPSYRARVTRPATGKALRIAVIGAGISGLAAARTLQDHAHDVIVFEKARGPGGRASTRRYGATGFDHGAQYFTARDPAFQRAVSAWQEAGVIKTWFPRMARIENDRLQASPDRRERYVAVPGMNALGKYLASDLTLQCQTLVAPPTYEGRKWHLQDNAGSTLGSFDALIVAAPAPQAVALLRQAAPPFADTAEAVQYDPMWALMVETKDSQGPDFDGLFVKDAAFSWIARNHAKPERRGASWVAHATAEWTRAHIDTPADEVAMLLVEAMTDLLGMRSDDLILRGAHRWLYSLVPQPLNVGALYEPSQQLAVCGDWCQGARIEGAYLSGVAAAGRLLGDLARSSAATSGVGA